MTVTLIRWTSRSESTTGTSRRKILMLRQRCMFRASANILALLVSLPWCCWCRSWSDIVRPSSTLTPSSWTSFRILLPRTINDSGDSIEALNCHFHGLSAKKSNALLLSSVARMMEQPRGGASTWESASTSDTLKFLHSNKRNTNTHSINNSSTVEQTLTHSTSKSSNLKITRVLILSLSSILLIQTVIHHHPSILAFLNRLFHPDKFRQSLLSLLTNIRSQGQYGLLLFTFGFMLWETCGLPTSIVETAAGMAFGFRHGLLSSFSGKTLGSLLAFFIGRNTPLKHKIKHLLNQQGDGGGFYSRLEQLISQHPLRSAFVVRYSVFPQIVKNYGLAISTSVTVPMFLLAIVLHGLPFSVLWAALGEDTALRLRTDGDGISSSTGRNVAEGVVGFVTVFGFVISPLITGWWLKDLRGSEHETRK